MAFEAYGVYDEATAGYETLVALCPDEPTFRQELADLRRRAGVEAKGERIIEQARSCPLCRDRHKFHNADYRIMPTETLVIWFLFTRLGSSRAPRWRNTPSATWARTSPA
jgi:hypothetical protein